ncbi:hypothetical protein PsorP6_015335 [Peronosclerospora sorghi]|uniref:Uncharacterized protein n=1 Tax=Peronosclerospora sorghi TaxID=230839 RepID=A0ACC0VR85_9STRA|nr:hypothetical protein PsorP6_015335 [Peronosclerospora sorghi]
MTKNVLTCAGLFYAATYIDQTGAASYLLWPVYWFFQGSYLTGIWVIIAHECGHQSYCSSEVVNNLIGLVLHSALLVPYHSWRISHRKHHSNTGSCENDEVFVPVTRSAITSSWDETLEDSPLYQLYRIAYMLVVGWMPGYLFFNATGPTKYWGKSRSHINPYSAIYADHECWMIVLSDSLLVLMLCVLTVLVYAFSFSTMVMFYVVPYFIVNAYLVLITYLQHTDTYIPHIREGEWNWLRGALCTVDRSFGPYLDSVIHRIADTHVCHHLFSRMPFYHCEEATNAMKPLLGNDSDGGDAVRTQQTQGVGIYRYLGNKSENSIGLDYSFRSHEFSDARGVGSAVARVGPEFKTCFEVNSGTSRDVEFDTTSTAEFVIVCK